MGISYFFKTLYLCSVTFKNESKMNKIGVFYGSTTGTTEDLARRIAEKLEVPSTHIYDVSKLTEALVNEYDVLVSPHGEPENYRTTGMTELKF